MDGNLEKLAMQREHCLELAGQAPTEAIRAALLGVAHLYEVEVGLTERARQSISESKELIARAEHLLEPRR